MVNPSLTSTLISVNLPHYEILTFLMYDLETSISIAYWKYELIAVKSRARLYLTYLSEYC